MRRFPSLEISGVNLVLNLGVRGSGSKNFNFSRQIFEKFGFFHGTIWICPGKLTKNFDFFRQKFPNDFLVIYSKMSVYPDKICHLQLNSRQTILFRLKIITFEHTSI